jgi:hypothetical protein
MPRRRYHPRVPPTRLDHLLAHPYEISTAVVGLTASLLILAGEIVAAITVSPSVDVMYGLVAWGIGLLGVPGHTLIIAGLLDYDDDLMNGWRLERTGLVLATFAWAIYTLAILAAFPGSVVTWGFGFSLIVAHCLRLRATHREERETRAAVARHEER